MHIDLTTSYIGIISLLIFVIAYAAVMAEEFSHLRKSKPVIISAALIWGLIAFYYVLSHFLIYIVLDHFFNWEFIIKDIIKRPFITFGFINFVLLLPLVFTSTNTMVKKISFKIWKRLHSLIYIIAPLAALHYYLLTKADKTEPLIYLGIILGLLLWRFYYKIIKKFI